MSFRSRLFISGLHEKVSKFWRPQGIYEGRSPKIFHNGTGNPEAELMEIYRTLK